MVDSSQRMAISARSGTSDRTPGSLVASLPVAPVCSGQKPGFYRLVATFFHRVIGYRRILLRTEASDQRQGMPVMTDRFVLVNPEGLHPTSGYAHLTIVEAGRAAHLAGLCPLDTDEQVVGLGDLGAQIDQVVANALAILSAADATPRDVVRSVIYVVSADSAVLASAWDRLNASPLAPAFATASTLLGVTALGYTGQLIEIDLTASLP